jgi:hypothetical protein
VLFHPDEAVVTSIKSVFKRFAETGSARRVWLWFRSAIHGVLANPVYAGAYVYGKTRTETTLDAAGARKKRIRHLPRDQWQVLIKEQHEGYIDWSTYEANRARIADCVAAGFWNHMMLMR